MPCLREFSGIHRLHFLLKTVFIYYTTFFALVQKMWYSKFINGTRCCVTGDSLMIETLQNIMDDMGIDLFGTSDVSAHVGGAFTKTPYAITLGVRLSDAVIDAVRGGPTKNYFHHYRTANAFLDHCALRCVIQMQRCGYAAVAIPASQTTHTAAIAADFPHKTAAHLAGLGFIGKNGLFISYPFGPRVRLATVMTDYPLSGTGPAASQCGACRICVNACPCGAIVGNEWRLGIPRDDLVDAALCSRYMKDKFSLIGRGSVCGICISACPFGSKPVKT
jgi:epoxyqueuosine reductase QueG